MLLSAESLEKVLGAFESLLVMITVESVIDSQLRGESHYRFDLFTKLWTRL